jgi:hypothetical protein
VTIRPWPRNKNSNDIQSMLKLCCVAALVVVAFFGLGPSKWQPRSGLGWEIDHFAGYSSSP